MAKLPRLTASEAERRLLAADFVLMHSKAVIAFTSVAANASSFRSIAARFCIRRSCARFCRRPARFEGVSDRVAACEPLNEIHHSKTFILCLATSSGAQHRSARAPIFQSA